MPDEKMCHVVAPSNQLLFEVAKEKNSFNIIIGDFG
jgi:hypothetical protein